MIWKTKMAIWSLLGVGLSFGVIYITIHMKLLHGARFVLHLFRARSVEFSWIRLGTPSLNKKVYPSFQTPQKLSVSNMTISFNVLFTWLLRQTMIWSQNCFQLASENEENWYFRYVNDWVQLNLTALKNIIPCGDFTFIFVEPSSSIFLDWLNAKQFQFIICSFML